MQMPSKYTAALSPDQNQAAEVKQCYYLGSSRKPLFLPYLILSEYPT